jgi:hypothetical protein
MPSSLVRMEPKHKDCRLCRSRCTRMRAEMNLPSRTILYRAPITILVRCRITLMAPCHITPRTSRETQVSVICLPRKSPV